MFILWVYTHNIIINKYNMPNLDKTGPRGMGPKTGLRLGKCKGAKPTKPGKGRVGRGLGRARGLGRRVFQSSNKE